MERQCLLQLQLQRGAPHAHHLGSGALRRDGSGWRRHGRRAGCSDYLLVHLRPRAAGASVGPAAGLAGQSRMRTHRGDQGGRPVHHAR
jgi:hypothetical protein